MSMAQRTSIHVPRARVRRPRTATLIVLTAGVMALVLGAAIASAARDDLELLSRASGVSGAKGNKASAGAARLSSDGRYVAFQSTADNLVADNARGAGIFVRDRREATTTLASRADGPGGAVVVATQPAISADGRVVAFRSAASTAPDAPAAQAIHARNLALGTTTLISRATGPAGVLADASRPAVSGDGRHIAFQTTAVLDPADTGAASDVYVRDQALGTTTLVSRATGAAGPATGGTNPSISDDGRLVAYEEGNQTRVRDVTAGVTEVISVPSGPGSVGKNGTNPEISAGGRYVAFQSTAVGLVPEDRDAVADVFVRDRVGQTTTLVSATGPVKGNGASRLPSISADGRFAAFESVATNLTPGDTDPGSDVYVHDLQLGTTLLASRAAGAGAKGNGPSANALISAAGNLVVFESAASNLHPADPETLADIFARDITGGVSATTPAGGPGAGTTATGSSGADGDGDGDGDGIADAGDACPLEDSRGRDANRNGCLDLRRLQPTFTLTPGRYVKLTRRPDGTRAYRALGVSVRSLVAEGLPVGAKVTLSCARNACATRHLTVGARRRVSFTALKGRRLRAGTRLRLVATAKRAVGAGAVYVIRRNDLRKQTFCVRPGPDARRGSCSTLR